MRALTLIEPYATLIAVGHKKIETRPWPAVYRGPILIHAGKSRECIEPAFIAELFAKAGIDGAVRPTDPYPWPLGMVVARARLVDCVSTGRVGAISPKERALGDYSEGRFAFRLDDVVPLLEPVPAKGALGLWGPMESLVAAVEAQIPRAAPMIGVEPLQNPPPDAPSAPPGLREDALAWAAECGLKGPLAPEGPVASPLEGGWAVNVREMIGRRRVGTARYDAAGKRSMWTMDPREVL